MAGEGGCFHWREHLALRIVESLSQTWEQDELARAVLRAFIEEIPVQFVAFVDQQLQALATTSVGPAPSGCLARGHQTVALIPLRAGDTTIGLLQVRDPAPQKLSREDVEFLEELGKSVGSALVRRRPDEPVCDRARSGEGSPEPGRDESQELHHQVRRERDRAQRFLDIAGVMIVAIDAEQRVILANKKTCEVLGFDEGELLGANWFDAVLPEREREEVKHIFSELMMGRAEYSKYHENHVVTKQGDERLIAWHNTLLRDEPGAITGSLSSGDDITERRRSERELERFFELTPELVCVTAEDGRFRRLGGQWERTLGFSKQELLGMPYLELVHPEDREATIHEASRHLAGQGTALFVNRCRTKGGDYRVFEWQATPVEDQNLFAVARDITERQAAEQERVRLQQQLFQAQKMESIGTLAGGIAHDFNNLLTGIMGGLSVMQLELGESHPLYEDLRDMIAIVERGADLNRQLLEFARLGKHDATTVNLNDVVQKTAKMFSRTRKDIILRLECPPDPLLVWADRTQVEQVLLNLLLNAGQAMAGGGDLVVRTESVELRLPDVILYGCNPGQYVKLVVQDNGVGMDVSTRERIFEPFFTTKEEARGTGLGLASVYGIVKNQGGFVTVESELGQGATFSCFLPESKEEVKERPERVVQPHRGRETILVIDDEEPILRVAGRMLQAMGYEILTASSGEEAVALFREHHERVSLVLLDMIMPGMTGRQTFDALREIAPSAKILLCSGYAEGHAAEILDRGCDGFLQKPFDAATLSLKLREILRAKPN